MYLGDQSQIYGTAACIDIHMYLYEIGKRIRKGGQTSSVGEVPLSPRPTLQLGTAKLGLAEGGIQSTQVPRGKPKSSMENTDNGEY
jgi:hypothetical protein